MTSSAPFASEQDVAKGSKGATEIGEGELSRTLISSDTDVSVALSGYVVAAAWLLLDVAGIKKGAGVGVAFFSPCPENLEVGEYCGRP
jgi:hypothetical protein